MRCVLTAGKRAHAGTSRLADDILDEGN